MRQIRFWASAALLLCGLTPPLPQGVHAQTGITLQEGEKIRIGLVDERDRRTGVAGLPGVEMKLRRVSGTLVGMEADTVF